VKHKTIIFDLGNVVFDISFESMYEYWARSLGCDERFVREKVYFDEEYKRFERGEISAEYYSNYIREKLEYRLTEEDFLVGWNSIYRESIPGIENLLKRLKEEGIQLSCLTNTNILHAEVWREVYRSQLEYFDMIFCSFEIGARKPERKVYETVLNSIGVEPECVLFIDDKEENVLGASDVGMEAFVFESPAQVLTLVHERSILHER
jgi:epoxide hydrolase-like predicted phosphatase